MTTTPDPRARNAARLFHWFRTGHDGVRTIASSPVLGDKSSPTDPGLPLKSTPFVSVDLLDHRHPRCSLFAGRPAALKSP
jgi:hypothetical protein